MESEKEFLGWVQLKGFEKVSLLDIGMDIPRAPEWETAWDTKKEPY